MLKTPSSLPAEPTPDPDADRLLAFVCAKPGVNQSQAVRALGVSRPALARQVRDLVARGRLEVDSRGREAMLFPKGTTPRGKAVAVALRCGEAQAVLAVLRQAPQATIQELADWSGLTRKKVQRHVMLLEEAGLILDLGSRRSRYVLASRHPVEALLHATAFAPAGRAA